MSWASGNPHKWGKGLCTRSSRCPLLLPALGCSREQPGCSHPPQPTFPSQGQPQHSVSEALLSPWLRSEHGVSRLSPQDLPEEPRNHLPVLQAYGSTRPLASSIFWGAEPTLACTQRLHALFWHPQKGRWQPRGACV